MSSCPSLITTVLLIVECVRCQKTSVRLIPGPDRGRLEVSVNETWGTVCESGFPNQAASVICRTLNQPSNNSYSVSGYKFNKGSLNPLLSRVRCTGDEPSLVNCTLTSTSSKSCSKSYVVGIVCTNEKVPALIKYRNTWFDSAQRIDIFNRDSITCLAGNDSHVQSFKCSIKLGNTYVASGSCSRSHTVSNHYQGRVTCTVYNWKTHGRDSISVEISTMYPPNDFVTSEIKVIEETTVNVSLTNVPNPLPYLTTWRKTGTTLTWNQTEAYRMYNNISRIDSGEFLVNISNQMNSSAKTSKHGNGLELLFVNVLYKPTLQCGKKHFVVEGSTFEITCDVDANPPPHLYIFDRHGKVIHQGSEPSLVIDSVGPGHVGHYKCTAINKMQDYNGRIESGIGLAEIEVALDSDQPTTVGDQPDGEFRSSPTEATHLDSTPMSSVTYVMIGITVVSLVAVLTLIIVVMNLRKEKGVLDISHARDIRSDHSVRYNRESDYISLDCTRENMN